MSQIPNDLKYNDSHEWVRLEADGSVTVGITDHAQEALGDVVFVEVPAEGRELSTGSSAGVVESVKAASDVYSPLTGVVVEVNSALADKPETINEDAYGEGWLFVVEAEDADQLNDLLGPDDYAELLEDEGH